MAETYPAPAELSVEPTIESVKRRPWKPLGALILAGSLVWAGVFDSTDNSGQNHKSTVAVAVSSSSTQPVIEAATTVPSTSTTTTLPLPTHEQLLQFYWTQTAAVDNADGKYDRLAQCETQSNWHVIGSKYSGGLGMLNAAWDEFSLPGMPDNAGLASEAEQIIVAERIRWETEPHGSWAHGKWGCAPRVGLP